MGSGTQNFVYQKWPHQVFHIVNFGLSHFVTLVLGGGGPGGGEGPMVVGGSNLSMGGAQVGCSMGQNESKSSLRCVGEGGGALSAQR